jgi:uncharacterized protein (TIGR00725 family)
MVLRKPIIGVMGSRDDPWEELSTQIGKAIAYHDYHLLTGAGAGVMTAVAKAFTETEEREGVCIGIVPTSGYDGSFVQRDVYPNPYIELPIITPLDPKVTSDTNPFSRNYVNVMTSHAMIILPGEHGTKNEASLGLMFKKPMILFGPEYAFKGFPEQATRVEDIESVIEFLNHATAQFRTDGDT